MNAAGARRPSPNQERSLVQGEKSVHLPHCRIDGNRIRYKFCNDEIAMNAVNATWPMRGLIALWDDGALYELADPASCRIPINEYVIYLGLQYPIQSKTSQRAIPEQAWLCFGINVYI